ncbi:hypothetical protein TRVL_05453 [Trypanosoma vivax]|nr:hypothetical protein TRVL_05453 [Trypanosoma vivax]
MGAGEKKKDLLARPVTGQGKVLIIIMECGRQCVTGDESVWKRIEVDGCHFLTRYGRDAHCDCVAPIIPITDTVQGAASVISEASGRSKGESGEEGDGGKGRGVVMMRPPYMYIHHRPNSHSSPLPRCVATDDAGPASNNERAST